MTTLRASVFLNVARPRWLVNDVSKQPIGPIFKGQAKQEISSSMALANDQLDAQLIYFIIRLVQTSTCIEQRRAHRQEVILY